MSQQRGGFQQRELSGALFKNQHKQKDNHPEYTGECLIEGETYRIAAWIKKSAAGNNYMSLSFTVKEEQPPQQQGFGGRSTRDAIDDDIPF